MLTLILSLPPHLFQPCSGSLFPPNPLPISYRPLHLSPVEAASLSLFTRFYPPSHLDWSWSNRLPGWLPHPPAATARLRVPPMPGGPMISSHEIVPAFLRPFFPLLLSSTCSQVPVGPGVIMSEFPFLPLLASIIFTPAPFHYSLDQRHIPLRVPSGWCRVLLPSDPCASASPSPSSAPSLGVF